MRATSNSNRVTARKGGKAVTRSGRAGLGSPLKGKTPRRWKIKTILAPVDFSKPSKEACNFALALAEQFQARVHFLHVVEQLTSPDFENFPLIRDRAQMAANVKRELAAFAPARSHPALSISHEVRVGAPWQEIVQAALEEDADLIVIATHGYTGLRHLVIGSVAEKVVRHAPCPVLALRDKDGKPARSKTERGSAKVRL